MLVKEAKAIASISNRNSKMPGSTFAQDAFACKVGSKLAKVKGSVCESCYARRIQKMRPSVNQGWTANYEKAVSLIASNPTKWVDACVFQILRMAEKTHSDAEKEYLNTVAEFNMLKANNMTSTSKHRRACIAAKKEFDKVKKSQYYHRWFDSGDIDTVDQLAAICEVARRTPEIKHWLPTREIAMVRGYLKNNVIPGNLVIRISSPMVGDKPVKDFLNTSTVHVKNGEVFGNECPAYKQGNSCGDCRNCWDADVPNVSYKKH
jgi:hypothetical protein